MQEGVGCVPPLETALTMKGRSSHEKNSEMHKSYSKSRRTHTHKQTIWAEIQPLTAMRANASTRWAAFRWTSNMWQFFILGTTCLYVATEQLYVLWMPYEMTAVHYFLDFPPTIFWGSHAGEVSYSKPIVFLLAFAWVRTELFSCDLRDKIHNYLLQKCKIPEPKFLQSSKPSHKNTGRRKINKIAICCLAKGNRWSRYPNIILLTSTNLMSLNHFTAGWHLSISNI